MKSFAVVTIISFMFFLVENHDHSPYGTGDANKDHQKPLWNYYGKAKIDLEHVFNEAKNIDKLQSEKKITQEQAVFYYHKLHDFNSDGYLDGLELLHAVKHEVDASPNRTAHGEITNLEQLAGAVDALLQFIDFDSNGYVEYTELAKYIADNTAKQKNNV